MLNLTQKNLSEWVVTHLVFDPFIRDLATIKAKTVISTIILLLNRFGNFYNFL